MVYAAILWTADDTQDVDELHAQVLTVLAEAKCDRLYEPFGGDPEYILARLPSSSRLDDIVVGLSPLPLTFMATISQHGKPFGCSPAPRIDRPKCMKVTG